MAYTSNLEGEERILSRLADLQSQCDRQNRPCFLGFLDEFQQKVCRNALGKSTLSYRFFGGYEDAERVFLGLSPWEDRGLEDGDFPIRRVEAAYRRQDKPGHRDFLGAVLALGLRREAVGDILVEEGKASLFLTCTAADVVPPSWFRRAGPGWSVTSPFPGVPQRNGNGVSPRWRGPSPPSGWTAWWPFWGTFPVPLRRS